MGAVGYTGGDPEKVDVAGDTMTGPLVLPGDPVLGLQAATKDYVDNHSGGGGGGGTPATTVTSETSFGIAPVVGTGTKYARDDHTHGSPATPTPGSIGAATSGHNHSGTYDPAGSASAALSTALAAIPAAGGSVVTETSYGQSSSVGAATSYSRSDHTHGTPGAVDVTGKVSGPASATDNAVMRFDGTGGKLAQNSLLFVNDDGSVVLTPIGSLAYAAGMLAYDSVNQCLTFFNDDSNVSMQVGQELWLKVRNVTGSTIANGIPVYISGANSGLPTIAPANANAIATVPAAGLTTEAIANNTNGYVTIAGVVNGIDTSTFAAGAQLYVGTAAGLMVTGAPSSPNFRNRVGSVMSVNTTTGQILVTPGAAVLGSGSANQVLGMNAGATAQEYKTVNGTTNQITVTHAVNSITLALAAALFASTTPAALGIASAGAAGSGTTLSRADHAHPGPGFGTVIIAETSFGLVTGAGVATTVARSDHTHGSPPAPTAASVGAVPLATATTKGDLYVATASGVVTRIGVGADGTFLKANSGQSTGLEWATPTVTGGGGGSVTGYETGVSAATGLWYRAPGDGPVAANVTATVGRALFVPFIVATSKTWDRIGCDVAVVAAATGVVRLGIFANNTSGQPGTLILDAGTIDATGTGGKNVTISQLLAPGLYWLCAVGQVAGTAQLRATVSGQKQTAYFSGANMFSGTEAGVALVATGVTGALASNPSITDNDRGVIIGMRAA